MRAATYQTLIGLLAVTGMRVGEAIALDREDFDLEHGLLLVRHAKFGKHRLVPLHPSDGRGAARLPAAPATGCTRARPARRCSSPPPGPGCCYSNVQPRPSTSLVRQAGLDPRSAACRPRIHDLRHSFAVATVLDWYRDGADVRRDDAAAVDLSRPHRPEAHLLVSVGRPGADGAGRAAAGRPPGSGRS